METVNGPSEKDTSRRYGDLFSENEQETLGTSGNNCSSNGSGEQIGSTQADSQWTNTTDWKLYPVRDTTAGKILERIESLEARHIKYVDSHESRLSARLEAARLEKEEFIQEANQIKSDIYHLAIAQQNQQANGNGHIN